MSNLEVKKIPGDYFSKILSEKDIHKKGTELFIKLVESIEVAFKTYVKAINTWREKDYERGYELRDEIIELERDADRVKDVFFESIFRKKAYLPQITEERHKLMLNADVVIDCIERGVRVLCLKKIDDSTGKHLLNINADLTVYEAFIGRGTNFRWNDH